MLNLPPLLHIPAYLPLPRPSPQLISAITMCQTGYCIDSQASTDKLLFMAFNNKNVMLHIKHNIEQY